jgi:hypothetical protein
MGNEKGIALFEEKQIRRNGKRGNRRKDADARRSGRKS